MQRQTREEVRVQGRGEGVPCASDTQGQRLWPGGAGARVHPSSALLPTVPPAPRVNWMVIAGVLSPLGWGETVSLK